MDTVTVIRRGLLERDHTDFITGYVVIETLYPSEIENFIQTGQIPTEGFDPFYCCHRPFLKGENLYVVVYESSRWSDEDFRDRETYLLSVSI